MFGKLTKKDQILYSHVQSWFETGDIYHRDMALAELSPALEHPTKFQDLCMRHFLDFPDDVFYLENLKDCLRYINNNRFVLLG